MAAAGGSSGGRLTCAWARPPRWSCPSPDRGAASGVRPRRSCHSPCSCAWARPRRCSCPSRDRGAASGVRPRRSCHSPCSCAWARPRRCSCPSRDRGAASEVVRCSYALLTPRQGELRKLDHNAHPQHRGRYDSDNEREAECEGFALEPHVVALVGIEHLMQDCELDLTFVRADVLTQTSGRWWPVEPAWPVRDNRDQASEGEQPQACNRQGADRERQEYRNGRRHAVFSSNGDGPAREQS